VTKGTALVTYKWVKDGKQAHRQVESNMKDETLLERQQHKHLSGFLFIFPILVPKLSFPCTVDGLLYFWRQ